MVPRHLLVMIVLLLVFTACGGDDDGNTDADAAEPTTTTASQSGSDSDSDDEESDDAEQEVDEDYLQGEWCSVQDGDSSGTTYVFEGNTFEYGRSGSLSPGGNIPTFLIGVKVVSVEADEFIATEFGREIVFTRGACS